MPDNTDSPPETGDIPFHFGIDAGNKQQPDRYRLSLQVGDTWYETNAVFGNHLRATEFVHSLNNTLITGHSPRTQVDSIPLAFNTLYEQTHDSHRLILHLKDSVILTGYFIDTDTISPDTFCHAMNRQTRLDNHQQHELIMNSIISPPDINTPVSLH
ncbi:MAG: hypothetical protein OXE42_13735 [Gammaproteobacteria bacterium]|nr:hypothetical protein [Gammaproteobacteria bacterium]